MAGSTIVGGPGNDVLHDDDQPNMFDGGGGTDTVSYANSTRGVIADLASGHAYKALQILPFGDSITYGVIGSTTNTESGGYRKFMQDQLGLMNVSVDFVGTLSNGPAGMVDRDHEGHRGWSLNQLDAIDESVVAQTGADAVLLIAGTNDSSTDSVSTMLNDLRNLLLSLTSEDPEVTVFVGSVPPVRVGQQSQARADRVDAYNDGMPAIVAELAAMGRNIVFVDMRDLTPDDITAPPDDSGLHPTAEGYEKIAAHWLEALEQHFGLDESGIGTDRDSFVRIENLTGSAFADHLRGDDGPNRLEGLAGDDVLVGQGGADVLIGGSGADMMTGGAGNDVYHVDNAGDETIETAGGGADEVHAYVDWTLADHVENLFLRSAADLAGTGNSGANVIFGNSGANMIEGLGGDDLLDGRGGADTMIGGPGDDIYYVENTDDRTIEAEADGVDEVHAYLDWTLADHVENLFLRSAANLAGTGNSGANVIIGNSGANVIEGRDGDDLLEGRGGSDRIGGGGGNDILTGGTGNDAFVFHAGDGHDTITDFDLSGDDRLEIFGYQTYGALLQEGGDTIVVLSENDTLTLKGVFASSLTSSDFMFT